MIKNILIFIVATEHIYIMILEMFLWDKPIGLKSFGLKKEQAKIQKKLAQNQGLYNGFLAAGLYFSLLHPNKNFSFELSVFFLTCVVIAAIFGAFTANKRILLVQGLPAIVALIFTLFS